MENKNLGTQTTGNPNPQHQPKVEPPKAEQPKAEAPKPTVQERFLKAIGAYKAATNPDAKTLEALTGLETVMPKLNPEQLTLLATIDPNQTKMLATFADMLVRQVNGLESEAMASKLEEWRAGALANHVTGAFPSIRSTVFQVYIDEEGKAETYIGPKKAKASSGDGDSKRTPAPSWMGNGKKVKIGVRVGGKDQTLQELDSPNAAAAWCETEMPKFVGGFNWKRSTNGDGKANATPYGGYDTVIEAFMSNGFVVEATKDGKPVSLIKSSKARDFAPLDSLSFMRVAEPAAPVAFVTH